MKVLFTAIVVLLVGVSIIWLSTEAPPEQGLTKQIGDETGFSETQVLPEQSPAQVPSSVTEMPNEIDQVKMNQQKLKETKQRLDHLMLAYNDNLHDSEQKKIIKQEMDVLLDEYNKLILPVALEKIKHENESKGN